MMKKIYILLIFALILPVAGFAQVMRGQVFDAETNQPMIGVSVIYKIHGETKGIATNGNGEYELALPEGGADVTFSYVGYEEEHVILIVKPREVIVRDIYMVPATNLMENVVVSAGRFEQKLSEITVSMDLLKSSDIAKQSPTDISGALNTLPGVDINDKQPSIRGGSGWTYGVGSRSLILVDGMSILNPGTGEINWNTIPMENLDQVEVLKGASSVLYGSSALNGLINIRTSRPGLTPQTTVKTYVGIYGKPAQESYQWYDRSLWTQGKYPVEPFLRSSVLNGVRNPLYEGLDISHSRRIGNFDVIAGLDVFTDEGFREQGYNQRFRVGGTVTYHHPSAYDNIITYGANVNFLSNKYGDFFIWRSPKEPYRPSPFTNMGREGNTTRIDPFYNFTNPYKNTSHKIKGRFFYRADNITQTETGVQLTDIIGNMGTDLSAITSMVNRIQGGDYSDLTPLIGPAATGDLNGFIDGFLGLTNQLFPNATTSDLSDLIGWIMRRGMPSSQEELIPWLTNAIKPTNNKTQVDKFYTYYLDYQYSKKINEAQVSAGATYEHVRNTSATTGVHNSDNIAAYVQYDQRFFDRLSISLGFRGEYYRVDTLYKEAQTKIFGLNAPFKPIFRGGLNYKLAEYSYLRASFGQGYRYPSIVEKYARKDIGGVGVYPNPELQAESGYNAEIGFKQGYKIGRFQGFMDIAGFFTEYRNMVEFRFGIFNNRTLEGINSVGQMMNMILNGDMPGIGAQFYNVSKARISGIDVSTNGVYNMNRHVKMFYNLGYVFIEPVDVDYKKKNEIEDAYTDPLQMKEKSNRSKYLKYRQKHTVKGTFDFEWNRLSVGMNMTWKSKTLAVDYLMVDNREKPYGEYQVFNYIRDIMFGNVDGENLESYWDSKNKGYFVMDLRFGVKVTKELEFQLSVNNVFNKEYSTRPMALAAPRTSIFQVKINF